MEVFLVTLYMIKGLCKSSSRLIGVGLVVFQSVSLSSRRHATLQATTLGLSIHHYSMLRYLTRPDTRPPVADSWAGAEIRVFTTRSLPTDQRTDGQNLL